VDLKIKYLSFLVVGLGLLSCSDDGELTTVADTDFFPLEKGAFYLYDVDETIYSGLQQSESFQYELRVVVADSFINATGGVTYVLQRFRKDSFNTDFQVLESWSSRIEPSQVVVSEGNISFVKLAFPLVTEKEWNGNAVNNLGGEEVCGENPTFACDLYTISNTGFAFQAAGQNFNETIEVTQNNNSDIIVGQDIRKEIYVRNVGLVYKESTVLEFCTVGDCIGQQQIEKGFLLKQTLKVYGKE